MRYAQATRSRCHYYQAAADVQRLQQMIPSEHTLISIAEALLQLLYYQQFSRDPVGGSYFTSRLSG